jgi:hypothetical protein
VPKKGPSDHKPIRHTIRKLKTNGLAQQRGAWPDSDFLAGPADTTVLPATVDIADPDGSNGATLLTTFASLIAESGD